MKLICGECRRVVGVRRQYIEELGVCIEGCRPILVRREHEAAEHLVCPFCTVKGNGVFWLQRLKPLAKQGEAA
jgi:hypothetical protein